MVTPKSPHSPVGHCTENDQEQNAHYESSLRRRIRQPVVHVNIGHFDPLGQRTHPTMPAPMMEFAIYLSQHDGERGMLNLNTHIGYPIQ